MSFGGAPKVNSGAAPPPPPMFNPTPGLNASQMAAAQAAGGEGLNGTIKTGMLGASAPSTAKQTLGGGK